MLCDCAAADAGMYPYGAPLQSLCWSERTPGTQSSIVTASQGHGPAREGRNAGVWALGNAGRGGGNEVLALVLTQRLPACSARKFIKKKPEASARNGRKKEARRREAGQDGGDGGSIGGSRGAGWGAGGHSQSHESDEDAQRVGSKWKKTKYVRRHRYGASPRPELALVWPSCANCPGRVWR
jgi:hypothetical protein